jgi:hypothetical protein
MSTSPVEHKTSPIPLEEFKAGFLKPASYSEEDIAKVMMEHLSRKPEDLTDRQKEGLARFKYDGSWNLADTQNIRGLKNSSISSTMSISTESLPDMERSSY